jgi:hypothetical protein
MGPHEQRLREALAPASRAQIERARAAWRSSAVRLGSVATSIASARPEARTLGDRTADAADAAFAVVQGRLERRQQEMNDAEAALAGASAALARAESVRDGWDAEGAITPPREPDWSSDDVEQIRQLTVHHAQRAAYQAQYDAREAQAEQTMRELDASYRDSADAMRRVHGEPPAGSTGGGGSTTAAGGGARPAAGGGGGGASGGGGTRAAGGNVPGGGGAGESSGAGAGASAVIAQRASAT